VKKDTGKPLTNYSKSICNFANSKYLKEDIGKPRNKLLKKYWQLSKSNVFVRGLKIPLNFVARGLRYWLPSGAIGRVYWLNFRDICKRVVPLT
jgi:hypothetical protein